MNFLIAIISEAYEEVLDSEEINTYNSRCALNIEMSIVNDYFDWWKKIEHPTHQIFYMRTTVEEDESAHEQEFAGYVKTLKNYITKI